MAGQGDAILALDLFRLLRAVDPLSRVGIDVVWPQFLLVTVIRRRDLALRTGGVENGSAWRSPRAVRSGRRKLRRTAICTSFFIAGRRSERVRHGSMPL
jgi:hypothetical protein